MLNVASAAATIRRMASGGWKDAWSSFAPAEPKLPKVSAKTRRVTLVVDDNADLRASVRELLEPLNLDVVEAANGQEAFNFLVLNPTTTVELIILDLQMPVMDGWQFLTLVKSYIRLSKIPVVVASSFASTLQPQQREGVAACLQTPKELPRLTSVVSELVAS